MRAQTEMAATAIQFNSTRVNETVLATRVEHRDNCVDVFQSFNGDIRFANAKVVDGGVPSGDRDATGANRTCTRNVVQRVADHDDLAMRRAAIRTLSL